MFNEIYGDKCMSRARVFERHKRFCSGQEDVGDDDRSGRPTTSLTDGRFEEIHGVHGFLVDSHSILL